VKAQDDFDEEPSEQEPAHEEGVPLTLALDAEPTTYEGDDARAEVLLARVKANPNDTEAVDELVTLLATLGRDFELFALLQASYDEAEPSDRARLAPRQREVLERMAKAARDRRRETEAAMYDEAAVQLRGSRP